MIGIESFNLFYNYIKNINIYELCSKDNIKSVRIQNLKNKIWKEHLEENVHIYYFIYRFDKKLYLRNGIS